MPLLLKSKISSLWPASVNLNQCFTWCCRDKITLNVDAYQILNSIHVNLIITLSLGSIETDRVISELCYNEIIYYRHIAK